MYNSKGATTAKRGTYTTSEDIEGIAGCIKRKTQGHDSI